MKARVAVGAGVCGFRTEACAESEDSQHVRLAVTTDCANTRALSAAGPALPRDIHMTLAKE